MLPRLYRLTQERDFNRAFRQGRSWFGQLLGVKIFKNNLENSRFGFIVANKVAKKASRRNLIKRRLRATIQAELPKIKSGYDFVIIALAPIVGQNYQTISRELKNCLKKLNVL